MPGVSQSPDKSSPGLLRFRSEEGYRAIWVARDDRLSYDQVGHTEYELPSKQCRRRLENNDPASSLLPGGELVEHGHVRWNPRGVIRTGVRARPAEKLIGLDR